MTHQPGDFVYVPRALRIAANLPSHIPAWRAVRQFGLTLLSVQQEWPAGWCGTEPVSAGRELRADWTAFQWLFDAVAAIDDKWAANGCLMRPDCALAACRACWQDQNDGAALAYQAPPWQEATQTILGDAGLIYGS